MRAPGPAGVRGADGYRHRGSRRRRAQQASGQQGRLEKKRGIGGGRGASEQLGGEERPLRVGFAAVRVEAGDTARPARDDERPDAHPVARQLDRQVRDVGRRKTRGAAWIEEAVGDDDRRHPVAVLGPPSRAQDVHARAAQGFAERVLLTVIEVVRHLHDYVRPGLGVRGQGRADALDEALRLGDGCAETGGEPDDHRVGHTRLERIDQALLPESHLVELRDGVGSELHGAGGPPQRNV